MSYISKEEAQQVKEQVKEGLKKYGFTGSVKRENSSKVVLSLKTNGKLINEFANDEIIQAFHYLDSFNELSEENKAQYFEYKEKREYIFKTERR